MSATSILVLDTLRRRSADARPGVRKAVKAGCSKVSRKQAKAAAAEGFKELSSAELRALSSDELDAYAEALLRGSVYSEDPSLEIEDDGLVFVEQAVADAEFSRVPLHLQAALPDWMLSELQAANGNAFDELSLFEEKRPLTKAAISRADETADELLNA